MFVRAWPRLWRHCQGREGEVKAVGAWSRSLGRSQGLEGVAKVVEAVGSWLRPWGHSQGLGGVVKAVWANPNPNPKAVGHS